MALRVHEEGRHSDSSPCVVCSRQRTWEHADSTSSLASLCRCQDIYPREQSRLGPALPSPSSSNEISPFEGPGHGRFPVAGRGFVAFTQRLFSRSFGRGRRPFSRLFASNRDANNAARSLERSSRRKHLEALEDGRFNEGILTRKGWQTAR